RFYRERGLLPPGQRHGRSVRYGEAHLERVRQVRDLLARGYSVAAIGELLDAWEGRTDLAAIIGLKEVVHRPSGGDGSLLSGSELTRLLGGGGRHTLERAVSSGLVRAEGRRFRVSVPLVLDIVVRLVADGVSTDHVLGAVEALNRETGTVAKHFVDLFVDEVWIPFERTGFPDLGAVIARIETYRRFAEAVLSAAFARAMQVAIDDAAIGRQLPHQG